MEPRPLRSEADWDPNQVRRMVQAMIRDGQGASDSMCQKRGKRTGGGISSWECQGVALKTK